MDDVDKINAAAMAKRERDLQRRQQMPDDMEMLVDRLEKHWPEVVADDELISAICGRYVPRSEKAPAPAVQGAFDLVKHLHRQRAFSECTFGPGQRTLGVIDHIRKELREIEADPTDTLEWVDVILLALDGAWRHGASPEEIAAAIEAKQTKNEGRTWPDWRTADPNKGIEHDRSGEAPAPAESGAVANTDIDASRACAIAEKPSDDDFDDHDDDCFMCGGSGILEDSCVCEAFEDTCMCLEPEPRECPECLHRAQSEELAKLHSKESSQ